MVSGLAVAEAEAIAEVATSKTVIAVESSETKVVAGDAQVSPPQTVTSLVVVETQTAAISPMPPMLPMPKAIVAANPPNSKVVQSYAQALQLSLGRDGRAPWFLGGLALYDDLCGLQGSLVRCLRVREETHLRHWHDVLARLLPVYAEGFAMVRQGQAWVNDIRLVLDEATLPTHDTPGPGGDAVACQLAHALGQIATQPVLRPWQEDFRHHLFALSERYWQGLFPCYDIVGLPRTNNDQESLFGQTKRGIRRHTGLRQIRQPLQRQGAWLIYQSHDETAASLHSRLQQITVKDYRAEQARWKGRQGRFHRRYRWRHDRPVVLAELEAAWAAGGP